LVVLREDLLGMLQEHGKKKIQHRYKLNFLKFKNSVDERKIAPTFGWIEERG
jgi:hypothetical protein